MANFISYFGSTSGKTQISPCAELNMVQIGFRVQIDTVETAETSYTHKNTGAQMWKHRLGLIATLQTSVLNIK